MHAQQYTLLLNQSIEFVFIHCVMHYAIQIVNPWTAGADGLTGHILVGDNTGPTFKLWFSLVYDLPDMKSLGFSNYYAPASCWLASNLMVKRRV